jgi:hypothetical protein
MATKYFCGTPFGIVAARISLADLCLGDSITGTTNGFVTDALESGSAEWQIRAGRKIQKESGDSNKGYAVDIRRADSTVGVTLKTKMVRADQYLESLFTNGNFLTQTVLADTHVKGWIGKAGAVTSKLVVELWEEVEFAACDTDTASIKYQRHVFGIGNAKPVNKTFSATDNRPMELEFDMQPFRPAAAWNGPHGDFPAYVVTGITAFLAADAAAQTTGLSFYETALPTVTTCGLIAVA